MLKVTFCAYDGPQDIGGTSSWILRLFPALREFGIEVRCLFFLWGGAGRTLKALRAQGFDCPAINCPEYTADRVKWILEKLAESPPDVFVPNTVTAAYFAVKWVKKANVPTVGVLHSSCDAAEELQSVFVFGTRAVQLTSIVCVSKELEKNALDRKPKNTIVYRIPCGVPIPNYAARPNHEQLRLVYLGRLTEEAKRVTDVTRALCRAVNEVPETEAVIYGDGPARNDVIGILDSFGPGLPVHYGGIVDSDLIQEELKKCDVLVLLSDYEGLPVVVMEAMACGVVPVCMRNCTGVTELVIDGVTGLLVEDRSDHFIAAIRRLKADPKLLKQMSEAGRKKVSSEYASHSCAKDWILLLEQLGQSSLEKKRIVVPKKIRLGPALEHESDPRPLSQPRLISLYNRARKVTGRIRRRLLGQPIP